MSVSVVIPAYNALKFLPQTLASIRAQTFRDFDITVVDDGSSDGTRAWLTEQRDPQLKVVYQTNQGVAQARNTGIWQSRGDYIAFLDADDLWEPTKLEQQVACLEANPGVGLVHTAIRYIDEAGNDLHRTLGVQGEGSIWHEVVLKMPVRCGSTPLIRRSCFAEVGGFETSLRFAEEWDMWIRIARRFDFAIINEPLVRYRQHPNNMTKSYKQIAPNLERVLERAFQDAPEGGGRIRNEAFARAYLFAAWRAYFVDDFSTASTLQQRAFNMYPRLRFVKNSINLSARLAQARLLGRKREPTHL